MATQLSPDQRQYTMIDAAADTMKSFVPKNLQEYPWFVVTWILYISTLFIFVNMSFIGFLLYMAFNAAVALVALKYFDVINF